MLMISLIVQGNLTSSDMNNGINSPGAAAASCNMDDYKDMTNTVCVMMVEPRS